MSLAKEVHDFWFNNEPGAFDFGFYSATRAQIDTYGGPNPDLAGCEHCQKMEWRARLMQVLIRDPAHDCDLSPLRKELCAKQGDDRWTPWHRDFRFAQGCDPKVKAPKGAVIFLDERTAELWQVWNGRRCEQLMPRLRKQFARAAQIDVYPSFEGIDWDKYDFWFFMNTGRSVPLIERPHIPLIMYAHDPWGKGFQEVIDHYCPQYLLTPYPATWRRMFKFTGETGMVFYPQPEGTFFARPNLDEDKKEYDLLVIGALKPDHLYAPRQALNAQIRAMPGLDRYRVGFSHHFGSNSWKHEGPVDFVTGRGERVRYLNAWSAFLGTARFVIFGPCAEKANDMLLMKYYECLGSGAVPIMPAITDLHRLGVRPYEHYVPFERVDGRNDELEAMLENPWAWSRIAENAVTWYQENADALLYNRFENLVLSATGWKYPQRRML